MTKLKPNQTKKIKTRKTLLSFDRVSLGGLTRGKRHVHRFNHARLGRKSRPQHRVEGPRPRGVLDEVGGTQKLAAEVADPDGLPVRSQVKLHRQSLRLKE